MGHDRSPASAAGAVSLSLPPRLPHPGDRLLRAPAGSFSQLSAGISQPEEYRNTAPKGPLFHLIFWSLKSICIQYLFKTSSVVVQCSERALRVHMVSTADWTERTWYQHIWHCICQLSLRPGSGACLKVRSVNACALTYIGIDGGLSSFSPWRWSPG